MELEEKKKKRFQYLRKLYDITEGDRFKYVSEFKLGEELGLSKDETHKIVDYLVGEGLVKNVALGGTIAITHEGVKEVESALENPKKPTEHFPPINIIKVGKMIGSQIQQSTPRSSQNISLGNLTESKKRGYIAGIICLLIGIIFAAMIFKIGWDLTGQILTAFSALFSLLGIGSLIKPESVGVIASQLLENISRNVEETEKKH